MTIKESRDRTWTVVLTRGGIRPGDQGMINEHPLFLRSKRKKIKKKGR
jgi:hypothetical protein